MRFLTIFRDRRFQQSLLLISLPIAFQNLITYCTGMVDTVMLGQLGEVQLAAATVASQPGNIFIGFTFGVVSGSNILLSQYWGKRDVDAMRNILAIMYWATAGVSVLVWLTACLAPEVVMGLFTQDAEIIACGAPYLQLVSWCYLPMGLSNAMLMSLRSVGTVRISLVVYLLSLCTNAVLNWGLIFGRLGMPALGMQGAALATVLARLLELTIGAGFVLCVEQRIGFRLCHLFRFDPSYLKDFFRIVSPVMINEVVWSMGGSTLIMVMGRMGRAFVTASSITSLTMQLAQIFANGLSNAFAVLVGNSIGEGQLDHARSLARGAMLAGGILGIFAGTVIYCIRPLVISFYNIPPATQQLTMSVMASASIVAFFTCVAILELGGVIRGGGDIHFMLAADSGLMWFFAIPLGALCGLVLGWPPAAVYLVLKSDDILKIIFCSRRISSDRWIRVVTR